MWFYYWSWLEMGQYCLQRYICGLILVGGVDNIWAMIPHEISPHFMCNEKGHSHGCKKTQLTHTPSNTYIFQWNILFTVFIKSISVRSEKQSTPSPSVFEKISGKKIPSFPPPILNNRPLRNMFWFSLCSWYFCLHTHYFIIVRCLY